MSGVQLSYPRATDMGWQSQAACRDRGNDLFFGLVDTGSASHAAQTDPEARGREGRRIRRAKEVCGACPVKRDCLQHAMEYPERWGVWGGTTAAQRAKARTKSA